jgi:DNA-binding PadR family transcriptional regulator
MKISYLPARSRFGKGRPVPSFRLMKHRQLVLEMRTKKSKLNPHDQPLKEFEEVILFLVGKFEGDAYAFRIAEELESHTKSVIPIARIHSTLSRLEKKGLLRSKHGPPTVNRDGYRKRIYQHNREGRKVFTAIQSIAPEMISSLRYQ